MPDTENVELNTITDTSFSAIFESLATGRDVSDRVLTKIIEGLLDDPPETRLVEPPGLGNVVAFPRVGGLHHRYGRIAA